MRETIEQDGYLSSAAGIGEDAGRRRENLAGPWRLVDARAPVKYDGRRDLSAKQ
jgi:hypothetical protein